MRFDDLYVCVCVCVYIYIWNTVHLYLWEGPLLLFSLPYLHIQCTCTLLFKKKSKPEFDSWQAMWVWTSSKGLKTAEDGMNYNSYLKKTDRWTKFLQSGSFWLFLSLPKNINSYCILPLHRHQGHSCQLEEKPLSSWSLSIAKEIMFIKDHT